MESLSSVLIVMTFLSNTKPINNREHGRQFVPIYKEKEQRCELPKHTKSPITSIESISKLVTECFVESERKINKHLANQGR